ncbi:cytochrome P450 [Cladochytrium replicatum]|nr:cytochrome P450 [Cladochytrium replicatum]
MQSVWQGWSLLMGSFVTTAYTFAWLIHHMASDPELQQRVRAEIESVVPKDTHLTLEHISKMHLMDSLVREVIRMHQHGPMGRAAQADIKFGEFDIPKGTAIAMALPAIHFNDENFVEAAKFKPDRFLNEEGQFDAADKVRSCTLTVFGAGRHPCLGMRLATTELKVFTYELLSKYDLVMANNPPTPVTLGMGFDEPKTRFQIVPRGGRD